MGEEERKFDLFIRISELQLTIPVAEMEQTQAPLIKVMQVTYSLDFGGAERLAVDLASKVDRNTFSTSICALDYGGRFISALEAMGIPWHFFNRRGALDFRLWKSLYFLFKREHIDIIQTHHAVQLFNAFFPAVLNGVKILHTEHEYQSFLNKKIDLFTLRILAPFCGAFVTVGDHLRKFFIQKGIAPPNGIVTIPNGVETEMTEGANILYYRRQFGFPPNSLVLGIVARLEWRKDHRTLLHALARIYAQFPNARLLVVGDGYQKQELMQVARDLRVEGAVHFAGSREDIPQLLQSMDIFILSSLYEGLPIALLEAMAAGKPVVSTSVGEIPQIITHGHNGLLVPKGDINSLASCITYLIENEGERHRLGRNGKQLVKERFSMGLMVKSYEAIYRDLISTGKKISRRAGAD